LHLNCISPAELSRYPAHFEENMYRIISCAKLWLAILLVSGSAGSLCAQDGKVLIAAASDLKFALDSVVAAYQSGKEATKISVVYGSSGKLYEQIVSGAPFDLYFSADMDYATRLSQRKMGGVPVVYGYGRLVLWSTRMDPRQKKLQMLRLPSIRKIAIANPLHAPYGKRAEEVLRNNGLYEEVRKKLVYGENISQAAQFVTSGAADAGIIALSLATSPTMKKQNGTYYLIPEEDHRPLEQGYIVLKRSDGRSAVAEFEAFLRTDATKAILKYFGFVDKP
jgi:molybdate transport system substrate-binding protein